MAQALRQKNKLRSTLCESCIPEQGIAGDVWFAKDKGTVWLVTKSGVTVSLSDILHGEVAHTPPRHGRDGKDAEPGPKGERGERGLPGKDAAPAKDGRDAVGIAGPQGRAGNDGRPGKDAPQRVEFDNLLSEHKTLRAEIAALKTNVDLTRKMFTDSSTKAQDYAAFLTARHAQRLKDHQQ